MKKLWMAGAALLLSLLLTACSVPAPGGAADVPADTPAPSDALTLDVVPASPAPAAPTAEPAAPTAAADAQRPQMLAAYRTALTDLAARGILPDGTDCGRDPGMEEAGNQFAIFDVDGDGKDELIVLYTTTFTGGHTAGIYGYDESTGSLSEELTEYPLLTFYDNGVIQAGFSHNQGLSMNFWPYTLYRYDPVSDRYSAIGTADAWEKAFVPVDPQGNAYPDAADISQTGLVYYVTEAGAGSPEGPLDASAYLEWFASHVGGAAEQSIPFAVLTEEAANAIS